jgi:hypothetical protein
MATLTSNLVKKLHRHRGIYSGKPYEVAGRIFLPAGTVLALNDILLGVPVGENQRVKEVTILAIGDTSTVAGSIGYFQMLDKQGNPVKVQRIGPDAQAPASYTYTSPASDPDAYRAAGQLDGYMRTEVTGATVTKLPGPVNIGVQITTGGTIAADTELFIGVMFDGETSTVETGNDPFMDQSYLLNAGA